MFWKNWYGRAIRSRIAPLVKYAKNLKTHANTILAHRPLEAWHQLAGGYQQQDQGHQESGIWLPG
jgi:hypothetical protein